MDQLRYIIYVGEKMEIPDKFFDYTSGYYDFLDKDPDFSDYGAIECNFMKPNRIHYILNMRLFNGRNMVELKHSYYYICG